jgi:uncharacterized protein (DUF2062 family)
MPRKFFRKYMPNAHDIKNNRSLSIFGTLLHEPNLWHLNRRSVANAFAVGLFFAWWPVPFQMVFAAAGAILCRANLPISAALVWITNPVTMPPMFYFAYLVGVRIVGAPERAFQFEASTAWLVDELHVIWKPFLTGCLSMAIISAVIGYISIALIWRYSIVKRHGLRSKRKR